jgi:hypothetical protein
MMQLVEEAVDGSWIGHCARIAIADESGIGSVYSPPKQDQSLHLADHVETVVDIGYRAEVNRSFSLGSCLRLLSLMALFAGMAVEI